VELCIRLRGGFRTGFDKWYLSYNNNNDFKVWTGRNGTPCGMTM